jgi:hypothetical protein
VVNLSRTHAGPNPASQCWCSPRSAANCDQFAGRRSWRALFRRRLRRHPEGQGRRQGRWFGSPREKPLAVPPSARLTVGRSPDRRRAVTLRARELIVNDRRGCHEIDCTGASKLQIYALVAAEHDSRAEGTRLLSTCHVAIALLTGHLYGQFSSQRDQTQQAKGFPSPVIAAGIHRLKP